MKSGSYKVYSTPWNSFWCCVGSGFENHAKYAEAVYYHNGDASRVALLYGPVVLAGELGTDGMQSPAPFSDPKKYNDYYTYNYNIPAGLPTSLSIDLKNPARSLQKTSEPLVFKAANGVTVSPLYDLHRQRYVVYWDNKE